MMVNSLNNFSLDIVNNINRIINENDSLMKNKLIDQDPKEPNEQDKEIIKLKENNNCNDVESIKLKKICFDSYL